MTKLQDFTPTQSSEITAEEKTESPINQIQEATVTKKNSSLRTRLLLTVLPTVLVPLVAAASAGWWLIHENIENRYRNRLREQSLLAEAATRDSIEDLFRVAENLKENPLVLNAIQEANQQVAAENLNQKSIEELEEQFAETKLLNPNVDLNKYLRQIIKTDQIAEVIITEKNGLNVAYIESPSDFVQRDDSWWQQGWLQRQWLGDLQYDVSTEINLISLAQKINNPSNGNLLGVLKLGVPSTLFEGVNTYLEQSGLLETTQVQTLNTSVQKVLATVTPQGPISSDQAAGGEVIYQVGETLTKAKTNPEAFLETGIEELTAEYDLQVLDSNFYQDRNGETVTRVNFTYEGRVYEMTSVPQTDWVTVASVEQRIIDAAGNELINVFVLVGGGLVIVAAGIIFILARQLSSPLMNVSQSAQNAMAGDFSVRATPQGSSETQALAESYNNLLERVQQLLQEQEATAIEQRQQREELEREVSQLMSDIENASEGDLTVRAQLMEGDIGIIADLFNAVVENLQDTAKQVKEAASRVSSSLGDNEAEIRLLAEGAIEEAEEIQTTLDSVEKMNRSIQEVAQNAQKAASIADTAFVTAQEGNQAMEQTVETIQGLRATVGDTAEKVQQMGASAQKISKVVSIIDQISLKTTLLAMNASVEANRAGELGQGFTAVAQQVEALSEQSASAAKEIAQIVSSIQNETQEAIESMQKGNKEVIESTRSVEATKARLAEVVTRSEEINNLMQSISDSTVSQAETSQAVSRLMEQVAQSSQDRSQTSKEVAQAIQETAKVAQSLEGSVEQFKVDK
ncbi:UNVERIFIED_CONTAM: hypothetical protein BEN50_01290 [Euhalothece sp. KZN 001]